MGFGVVFGVLSLLWLPKVPLLPWYIAQCVKMETVAFVRRKTVQYTFTATKRPLIRIAVVSAVHKKIGVVCSPVTQVPF